MSKQHEQLVIGVTRADVERALSQHPTDVESAKSVLCAETGCSIEAATWAVRRYREEA